MNSYMSKCSRKKKILEKEISEINYKINNLVKERNKLKFKKNKLNIPLNGRKILELNKIDIEIKKLSSLFRLLPTDIVNLIDNFFSICKKCYMPLNTKYFIPTKGSVEFCSIKCNKEKYFSELRSYVIRNALQSCECHESDNLEMYDNYEKSYIKAGYTYGIGDYNNFYHNIQIGLYILDEMQCFIDDDYKIRDSYLILFRTTIENHKEKYLYIPLDGNMRHKYLKNPDKLHQLTKMTLIMDKPFTTKTIITLESETCFTTSSLLDALIDEIGKFKNTSLLVKDYNNYYLESLEHCGYTCHNEINPHVDRDDNYSIYEAHIYYCSEFL